MALLLLALAAAWAAATSITNRSFDGAGFRARPVILVIVTERNVIVSHHSAPQFHILRTQETLDIFN
jgi:hypothetical protein